MTPASLLNLLGSAPPCQSPAVVQPADATATGFSAVLVAMLAAASTMPALDTNETPAEPPGSESTAGKHEKSGQSSQSETGEPKDRDQTETVITLAAPAVVLPEPLPVTVPVIREAPAALETAPAEIVPAGDPQIPEPLESAVPGQAQALEPVASEAASAPTSDALPAAPKQNPVAGELAFAARLTTSPDAQAEQSATAHVPERHLALPPDTGAQETQLTSVRIDAPDPARATAAGPAGTPAPAVPPLPRVPSAGSSTPVPSQAPHSSGTPDPETPAAEPQQSGAPSAKHRSADSFETGSDGQGGHSQEDSNAGAPVLVPARSSSPADTPVPTAAPRERSAAVPESAMPGPAGPEPKAQAVREVSVVVPGRMSANGSPGPQVELRIVERTGDVRVAVRTADPQLAGSLREELPQLVSQLGERGYSTETWHPGLAPEAAAGSAVRTGSTSAGSGSDDGTPGNSGRGGSASEGRDGNQGRREQNQNQPEWVDALDRSLGNDRTRARSIL